ncbi:hypothetical protein [Marinobacter arenosus]|uniref:hypothetical protein n=1 Tax=Marinobacter arenosus TaxID=2856822 RepID=UPI001C4B8E17|nr:hypothetical protein [Marinobacter arenosus]MBW0147307.1 hypothetical protein [Marinobacter arenosus]
MNRSSETTQASQPGDVGDLDTHGKQEGSDVREDLPWQRHCVGKRVSQKNGQNQPHG